MLQWGGAASGRGPKMQGGSSELDKGRTEGEFRGGALRRRRHTGLLRETSWWRRHKDLFRETSWKKRHTGLPAVSRSFLTREAMNEPFSGKGIAGV